MLRDRYINSTRNSSSWDVPLYSCFNGVAVYDARVLRRRCSCRYAALGTDCEHVSYHRCLFGDDAAAVVDPALAVKF